MSELSYRAESDLIPDAQLAKLGAIWVENFEGSLSDQAPAAGGFERIDAGVGPPDRDAAFGHSLARRFEARCCKLRRKAAEVREARNEADEIDDVRRRRMQLDYTLGRHRMER